MISEAYNIDCMDYMRTIPDGYFDLAVVDPPYGGANSGVEWGRRFGGWFTRYKTSNENRRHMGDQVRKKIIGLDEAPGPEYFAELFRVSKNQIIWGANYFNMPPTRCFIVWRKLAISEKFSMAMAEYAWTSFASNAKVFECVPQGTRKNPRIHPTQKPIKLYEWIYRMYAKTGDKILDTHLGSGSSRIAAYRMGLDFVGCEIDKEYFDKQELRFMAECLGEPPAPPTIQLTLF